MSSRTVRCANGGNVAWSNESVFQIPSLSIIIVVGDTPISLKVSVLEGICLLYNLVDRRSAEDVLQKR